MKHLQKLGYIAIGSVLTLAVMGTALATTGALTIEVNPINVQVNGATFQPKDAAGKTVPVFAYNGTTYAPLRALAEAYGLKVGYDEKSNMATVGETTPTKTPDAASTAADYSTWTAEEEKAYQEFKGMWEVEKTVPSEATRTKVCYGGPLSKDDLLKELGAIGQNSVYKFCARISGEHSLAVSFYAQKSDDLELLSATKTHIIFDTIWSNGLLPGNGIIP